MQQAYVDTDSGQGIIYIIVCMITITITITITVHGSRSTVVVRMVEEPEPSYRFAGTPRYTR